MGYYATFVQKQEKKLIEAELEAKKDVNRKHYQKYKDKEYHKKNYEKQKQRSREYYWKNREYILERQRAKKYETSEYYKQWYKNNREELNMHRYGKSEIKSKPKKEKKEKETIIEKPVSFTLTFT